MSRLKAHPLRALCRADSRMLRRHGITALYAALALIYTALIRFLVPAAESRRVTALLLITDPATLSLFFMGAIVLYEKTERLHAALYTAGIKPGAYLFSKCLNAAWLGALTGCFVVWFADPRVLAYAEGGIDVASVLNGDLTALAVTAVCMLLGGTLFTCLSLLPATAAKSLNGFVMRCAVVEIVALLPAVIDLFYPLPPYMGYHPAVLLTRALAQPQAAAGWLSQPDSLLTGAAFLGWLLLAALLAKAAVKRLLTGKGGAA